MENFESLSHVRWECKYHIVFIPKYRRKVIFGKLRRAIGRIIRELCQQKGVEVLEGHALNHAIAVNKLLGYENRVAMTNRQSHGPTEEANEQVYRFFQWWLCDALGPK